VYKLDLLSTQFSIQWIHGALSMERERAELQQETTYTPICHEPLLLWLGHTDEPYRTFSNSCPAQKLFTPAALHPTFRDSPFPEFV